LEELPYCGCRTPLHSMRVDPSRRRIVD
jgi:hypothetical protein